LKTGNIFSLRWRRLVITTDKQVRRLLKMSQEKLPLSTLAAKAGMDVKTARKYLRVRRLPSQMKVPRDWRTREDPFADVWPEVEALLKDFPELQALTIFQDLQHRYPGKFQDGQLRTLQRRIRVWRGLYGPDQEVYFPQVHYPGRVSQSDFTWMNSLDITIAGQLFPHLLYHFVLTYSNWEYAEVCFSESFESLSRGLQNALWTLGGIPESHRTDHLGAARFGGQEQEDFGAHYMALMRHYGLTPTKNNPSESHENGDVEQAHYRLKQRVDQALLLRGSRDFSSRTDYERFIRNIFNSKNRNRSRRFEQELAVLKSLPAYRLDDHRDFKVPVGTWSTVRVAHNTYSVPSRLIRREVTARLQADYVEIHFAGQCICSMERLRGTGKARIDYRHRYREEMFPSTVFRQTYDRLVHDDPKHASRRYLKILEWAAMNSESAMEGSLKQLLDAGEELDFDTLVEMSWISTHWLKCQSILWMNRWISIFLCPT
jgi:hypothetical protein